MYGSIQFDDILQFLIITFLGCISVSHYMFQPSGCVSPQVTTIHPFRANPSSITGLGSKKDSEEIS